MGLKANFPSTKMSKDTVLAKLVDLLWGFRIYEFKIPTIKIYLSLPISYLAPNWPKTAKTTLKLTLEGLNNPNRCELKIEDVIPCMGQL